MFSTITRDVCSYASARLNPACLATASFPSLIATGDLEAMTAAKAALGAGQINISGIIHGEGQRLTGQLLLRKGLHGGHAIRLRRTGHSGQQQQRQETTTHDQSLRCSAPRPRDKLDDGGRAGLQKRMTPGMVAVVWRD